LSKTLIISDIHQRIKAAQFLLDFFEGKVDHYVFLGDYFDDFKPEAGVEETCKWLHATSERLGDRATWLIGNHDASYFEDWLCGSVLKTKKVNCTGYTRSKSAKIKHYFSTCFEFWKTVKLCAIEQGYLISHAGFHPSKLMPFDTNNEDVATRYNNEWRQILDQRFLAPNNLHLFAVGGARGGFGRAGGPLWLDWYEEFEPIHGFPQIVGHSQGPDIRLKQNSLCVDCLLEKVVVLEDGYPVIHRKFGEGYVCDESYIR
jgi:hypothetical protein